MGSAAERFEQVRRSIEVAWHKARAHSSDSVLHREALAALADLERDVGALVEAAKNPNVDPPGYVHQHGECEIARHPVVGRCTCGGDKIDAKVKEAWSRLAGQQEESDA